MTDDEMLVLLRADLQRQGITLPGETEFLTQKLQAAKSRLELQGIQPSEDYAWTELVVSTAAWMYRKRINGEPEPRFLRDMRHDMLVSQKMRGGSDVT